MNFYPISCIFVLFDKLKGAIMFSKIDMIFSYHNLRIKEADIPKNSF